MNPEITQLRIEIDKLKQDLQGLNNEIFKGNFSARQDFSKFCDFRYRMKVPSYATVPTTVSEVGELIEVLGILYICTATTPTYTKVGLQT